MRQVVLDTETTGLSTREGHRIIEIGCIELVNRRITGRDYHSFLNPDRDIDEGAERVHGISRDDLEAAPRFSDIVEDFLAFIKDAELVIHNAEFDVGFIEHELRLLRHARPRISQHATVLDTLPLARKLHPGQRNSLDALCKRYEVDATKRNVHGALIDSELLARVYLAMTGGQTALSLDEHTSADSRGNRGSGFSRNDRARARSRHDRRELELVVIKASAEEVTAHEALVEKISKSG